MTLKQESLFIFLATVTVWCDIFPFGQKLGNKYNKAKIEQEKKMSNFSVTLLLKVGVGVLFFPRQLSGEGGRRRVHWWRWRCVCAYRGSLIHNQLLWARCTAPRVPDGGRGRGRAGAELQPELALRPGSLFLPVSLSLSLSLSLSRAPALARI